MFHSLTDYPLYLVVAPCASRPPPLSVGIHLRTRLTSPPHKCPYTQRCFPFLPVIVLLAQRLIRYQNVWMYVIHELEDAIGDCEIGGT